MTAGKTQTDETVGGAGAIAFGDDVLVQRCQNGDMQAFAALVAKYQDRVFNMAYRMCCRREEAEEIAQEAFCKALEKISQFRGESRFYTWLFRIAANLVMSQRRRSGRLKFWSLERTEASDVSPAAATMRSPDPAPPAVAMAAEQQQRVAAALESLPEDMRIVVILRDIEELDYSEISEVLGTPAGTVKSRLHRARCALKEKLADLVG